jgi:hypothetical protein
MSHISQLQIHLCQRFCCERPDASGHRQPPQDLQDVGSGQNEFLAGEIASWSNRPLPSTVDPPQTAVLQEACLLKALGHPETDGHSDAPGCTMGLRRPDVQVQGTFFIGEGPWEHCRNVPVSFLRQKYQHMKGGGCGGSLKLTKFPIEKLNSYPYNKRRDIYV